MRTILLTEDELRALVSEQMRQVLGDVQVKALEPMYTLEDACNLFKKNERTLYRWAKQGTIQIADFGGSRYVTGASIAKVLNT